MCQEEEDKAVPAIPMQAANNASDYHLELSSLLRGVMCFLSLLALIHHKIPQM